jgi:single-stranded-DNA-specific exonuclease
MTAVPTIKRRILNPVPRQGDVRALVEALLKARGMDPSSDADLSLGQLLAADALKDISKAACRVASAIEDGESILIVGDYDVDGATSITLMKTALEAMGSKPVNYLVPNRFRFGYGLSPEIVEEAHKTEPSLLITVDNGISSLEGVARASELGMDVIITDHHLPGDQLPQAYAIVNPNQPGDTFPSKSLAGVGVAFYLMAAVRAQLLSRGWFERRPAPRLSDWLDLVALGTVADMVPLDRNNRILVQQGLLRMRAERTRPGIGALFAVAGRTLRHASVDDMGFAVAPRLNAAGRLEDMTLGIECLLAKDFNTGLTLAQQLHDINSSRKDIETAMKADAQEQVRLVLDSLPADGRPWALCLFQPHWHEGVVGLVASRVKEQLHCPVVAFAPSESGNCLKGSARSVSGVHIRDALALVEARHPSLMDKFGGHAMAAGLSLKQENLPAFSKALEEAVREMCDGRRPSPVLTTDGYLEDGWLSVATAKGLEEGFPWGQGCPKPLFEGHFTVVKGQSLQERHLKLQLRSSGGRLLDAIAFGVLAEPAMLPMPKPGDCLHIVYRLQVNRYRGNERLQLLIEHFCPPS